MSSMELLLPILQATVVISLALMAGVALSLKYWVIPIIMHPSNTSRMMISQFDALISRGEKYLMPSSRVIGVALVCLGILTSQHPDPDVAINWKYYAVTLFVVAQVEWYENLFIFPINREVRAMGKKFEGNQDQALSEGEHGKLVERLERWNAFHTIRIILPLLGACISIAAVV